MENYVGAAQGFADKSQFILQVTHELRSPIAAVLGYHEMILKGLCGNIEPGVRMHIEKANSRIRKLLDIVDEMLDYAKLSASGKSLERWADVNIDELIQEAVNGRPDKRPDVSVEIVNSLPKNFVLKSNKDLMKIVLSGLIGNSVKYSPTGGTIRISAAEHQGYMRIEIADQGMGIDREELSRIFDEFYRTSRARVLDDDGTGLGLAIVCLAISYLRGHICVHSRLNQGTEFKICLPESSSPCTCPCDAYRGSYATFR